MHYIAVKIHFSMYFSSIETQRKIAGVIQKDIEGIVQKAAIDGGLRNTIISVSKVSATTELSKAKDYISIFSNDRAKELLEGIRSNQTLIKQELSQRTRYQLPRVPELLFYLDDSVDYIENIEKSLKRQENPIENRELLPKRKKS